MTPNTCSPCSQLAADIVAVGEPLRALISGLEPRDVPLPWAPEVMAAFAGVARLAESGRMLMTARAAEAGLWQRQGFASPADWLAQQQGTTTGRALADLETSERLDGLDATADAVRAGLLSPEQAGAVSDAAAVNPGAEDELLARAQADSLRRTRLEAARRKAEAQSENEKVEREKRVRKERSVRFWYANGAGNMEVCGPIDALKELEQLIQREVDRSFRASRSPQQRGSRNNYAFDALMNLGDNTGAGAGRSGEDGEAGAGSGRPSARRAPLTRLTLVRVDLGALMRGHTFLGELCEIGGVPVSVTELRRVLGDSVMQLVLTNGEAVIDVVNLNRKPTVAQMIAKLFHDSTCSVQGCDRAARLEFDHRQDWARVEVTELANLDLFCGSCHDRKTYENWQLVPGTGRRPMVPPDDPRHPDHTTKPGQAGKPVDAAGSRPGPGPDQPGAPPGRDAPGPDSPSARPGTPLSAELAARIARINRNEAEHQANLAGQSTLFETS